MVVRSGCFSPWMTTDVRSITRKEIMQHYRLLCTKRGTGTANKSMRVLSSMLTYGKAIYPELENWSNPVRVLAETRIRVQLKPKTRFIRIEQLPAWQRALDIYVWEARTSLESRRRSDIRLLLQLILMTGLRSNEARSLRWLDLDLPSEVLTVTHDVAKNHTEAVLPLNTWLVSELRTRQSTARGLYVFENDNAQGYIRNLKRPVSRISAIAGIPFTPHDLRRSFATYLDSVGTPFSAIKQLLNHKAQGDITERYIQKRSVHELRPFSDLVYQLIRPAIESSNPSKLNYSLQTPPLNQR